MITLSVSGTIFVAYVIVLVIVLGLFVWLFNACEGGDKL